MKIRELWFDYLNMLPEPVFIRFLITLVLFVSTASAVFFGLLWIWERVHKRFNRFILSSPARTKTWEKIKDIKDGVFLYIGGLLGLIVMAFIAYGLFGNLLCLLTGGRYGCTWCGDSCYPRGFAR